MPTEDDSWPGVRAEILAAAATLLDRGGPAAVTTRGVAARAGVQPPAIYRQFGDKDGLLDAAAEHVLASFVAGKSIEVAVAAATEVGPIDDLQQGWQSQLEFGLAHPWVFRLLSDPDRIRSSVAIDSGRAILVERVRRLAAAGRLRVDEEQAVDLIQSAGVGVVQTLLAKPADQRDFDLAALMWVSVLSSISTGTESGTADATRVAAITLRASAPDLEMLSQAERELFLEWLDRIISG